MRAGVLIALTLSLAACSNNAQVSFNPPEEQSYLEAINAARGSARTCTQGSQATSMGPSSAVSWNGLLGEVARQRAQYIADTGEFKHTEGSSSTLAVGVRALNNGYLFSEIREDLAQGQPDLPAVVQAWLDSPDGHCNAVMEASMKEMGMAQVGQNWVLVVAKP